MKNVALLTVRGVGEICAAEAKRLPGGFRPDAVTPLRNHDLLLGRSADPRALLGLRTAEDVFLLLGPPVKVVRDSDAARLVRPGFRETLLSAVALLGDKKKKSGTNYWVFVKQDDDHRVYRRALAAPVAGAVASSFRKWTAREPADVELWIFYVRGAATLALRLTPPSFRKRTYREAERPGSLVPTVAAAMVSLSSPTPEDYVLDPVCGTGTLLAERAAWGPASGGIFGGDADEEAVLLADGNLRRAGAGPGLVSRWDACRPEELGSHAGRVTRLYANLPFGKIFGPGGPEEGARTRARDDEALHRLHRTFFASWRRLLAPAGTMTVLSPRRSDVERAAAAARLAVRRRARVLVRGIYADVFTLSARRDGDPTGA